MELIDTFLNVSELKEWEKNLTTDGRHMLTGLVGSSKTLMIAKLLKDKKVPQLIVESDLYHAQQLQSDLENIIEDTRIELFPVEDMLVAEMSTSSPEYRAQRVSSLTALTSENPVIVITTVAGIRRFLPSVEYWKQHEIQESVGSPAVRLHGRGPAGRVQQQRRHGLSAAQRHHREPGRLRGPCRGRVPRR